MLQLPDNAAPITEIPYKNTKIFLKREDTLHPEISGNKYWKLFFNINNYLQQFPLENVDNPPIFQTPQHPPLPLLITFGGAFSNHISAVSFLGKKLKIPTMGIIRGEELCAKVAENPTLQSASENGMQLRFVSREMYRDKATLTARLHAEFPDALIIPEGGTNAAAVQGISYMLSAETAQFDYLCAAVGTGGTLAGISKFAEKHQKVLGFSVVKDRSLAQKISLLSGKSNFELIAADFGGYGRISDEVVAFANWFYSEYKIPLDPVYTGKTLMKIFELADKNYFPQGAGILAFHTGGLQGIAGANAFLKQKNRLPINF